MADFAKVVNGSVVKVFKNLKNYTFSDGRSTANFDKLAVNVQISEGLYPVVDNFVIFNPAKEITFESSYTINSDHVVRNWAKSPILLDEIKRAKIEELREIRQNLFRGSSFVYEENEFLFDAELLDNADQLQGWLSLPGASFGSGTAFTRKDGEEVFFATVGAFRQFALALGQRKKAIFENEKVHKATIKALTDADSVLAYDISTGW